MPAEPIPVHVPLDIDGRIAQDQPCIGCGYNLRGLAKDQACPECSRPVERSLRGELLRDANPDWLAQLADGMGWIAVSYVLALLMAWVFIPMLGWWFPKTGIGPIWAIALAGSLIRLVGMWKATSPEPRTLDMPAGIGVRGAVRLLLIVGIVLSWTAALSRLPYLQHTLIDLPSRLADGTGRVLFCIYLARLARRLPSQRLVARTRGVALAVGLLECLSTALSLLLPWLAQTAALAGAGRTWNLILYGWIPMLLLQALSVLLLLLAVVYRKRFRQALRESHQDTVPTPSP